MLIILICKVPKTFIRLYGGLEMLKCPKCESLNPNYAEKCNCGYLLAGVRSQQAQVTKDYSEVVVKDIHMKFGSMVWFMVKWSLASIPAIIILFFIVLIGMKFLKGLGHS